MCESVMENYIMWIFEAYIDGSKWQLLGTVDGYKLHGTFHVNTLLKALSLFLNKKFLVCLFKNFYNMGRRRVPSNENLGYIMW